LSYREQVHDFLFTAAGASLTKIAGIAFAKQLLVNYDNGKWYIFWFARYGAVSLSSEQ